MKLTISIPKAQATKVSNLKNVLLQWGMQNNCALVVKESHAEQELSPASPENSYVYQNKQDIIVIPFNDILRFSSNFHYVDIITTSKKHCQYTSLKKIIQNLPEPFIQVHKSHIINMAHIEKISGTTILLYNQTTIPIGRSYLTVVKNKFLAYTMTS